jgi:hypothetical protein
MALYAALRAVFHDIAIASAVNLSFEALKRAAPTDPSRNETGMP